ncbi:MAG: hypothetical protein QE271_06750 [Bacteriovoracaceae bacterium]|nr:hypothetical protein [Bacteriovoracaceae bacterium]
MTNNSTDSVNHKQLLDTLNSLYQQGDYPKAQQLLKENAASFPAGVWNYNQGVLSYKQGNVPLARLYWENAKRSDLSFTGVENNLFIAKEQLGLVNIESQHQPFWSDYLDDVGTKSDQSFLVFAILTLFFLILVGVKVKRPKWRYPLFVVLLVAGLWQLEKSYDNHYLPAANQAIILKETTLREGPSAIFNQSGKIPVGLKVSLGKIQDEWALIERPEEFYGWVGLNDLKVITTEKN